jgi:hypothetical protein
MNSSGIRYMFKGLQVLQRRVSHTLRFWTTSLSNSYSPQSSEYSLDLKYSLGRVKAFAQMFGIWLGR